MRWFCFFSLLNLTMPMIADDSRPMPPETRKDDVRDILHGKELVDPYRWLENQTSPETRAWIEAQNDYTEAMLKNAPGQDWIRGRLKELLRVNSQGSPVVRGDRYLFMRRDADADLASICLKQGREGKIEVLIDPLLLAADGTHSVEILDVSEDGKLLLYGEQVGGEDEITVRFFDVEQRKTLPRRLDRARYFGVELSSDASTLFYTKHGEEGSRVFRQSLKNEAAPQEIFGAQYGPGEIIYPSLSSDGRWLLIHVLYGSAAKKIEVYFQDWQDEKSAIQPVVNDIEARFEGAAAGRFLFLQTNWNSPNGRILKVDLTQPQRENWQEIVPEQKSALESFSLAGGKLFVNYLENVVSVVRIFSAEGKAEGTIEFPSLGSVSGVSGRWERDEAFYSFSSCHIPPTIYRYSVSTGKSAVWFRSDIPVKSDQMELSQVWYESKDGTKIPMFLLHKKGLRPTGESPTILYGYGGFNVTLTPTFSARMVTWVEMGGIFAIANLRGGGEFGEAWHEAGMQGKKQNVFDDFHAAARWLIDNDYTNPDKLAISGGSNGGLLVGAALTQWPELFEAVICSYPLLDMVRYHQFLVARFWIPEYGSSEDPQQFQTLLDYSPYHNVKPGTKYPATLFITGDSDTRVDPLHARKMAALLQNSPGSVGPILLHYDTKLGHSGGRPVSQAIDDLTLELSFLAQQLGMKIPE